MINKLILSFQRFIVCKSRQSLVIIQISADSFRAKIAQSYFLLEFAHPL